MIVLVNFTAIEARGITKISTVESIWNNTTIASIAGFAMRCQNALSKKNNSPLYPLSVSHIPPQPPMPQSIEPLPFGMQCFKTGRYS